MPRSVLAVCRALVGLLAPLLLVLPVLLPGSSPAWPLAAAPAAASLLHLEGPPPADLARPGGPLSPCTTSAHCARASWPVEDPEGTLADLLPVVLALDGVEVVETSKDYLHATVSSQVFGFVDDLELHADGAAGLLEARSVSRLGDSDLGVNARRLETLRRALPAG